MSNIPLLSIADTLERMSGDHELLTNLFRLFLADAPKKLQGIESAVQEKAFYQVERTAHSLKGASATVGATRLCQVAEELERAARTQQEEALQSLQIDLVSVCAQTLKAMQEYREQRQP